MKDSRTTTIGAIAFLAGVAVGALGLLASKDEERIPTLDLTGDDVPEVSVPGIGGEFIDVTPDNTTILDSLEGISVPGTEADIVNVRVLGLERAKVVAMWGSKGQNGDQPSNFRRMVELTTEHLLNIRNNSQHVTSDEKRLIESILEDRVASGEADATILES